MLINTCEFRKAVNLAYGQGGLKLEINIPPQHILAKSKGGLIIEGGVSSSEYGSSYIPQTEQHEPEGRMLFCLGNVTNLLDVTPSNQMPHQLSPPPIPLCVI